ncbi:glycoside hydrolase family 3 protein [Streptomyces profundus]|uniref:glycoside hydrolase family 3 protein n=1 Tax=Streptomyces profundus TaxID=2867410 RepID=UPI001D15E468|nr:glycoside hydrolase family 3 C-terminal domain-containing protein [Streptomyces sp. MA3_2.13]UED84161.1 glycoside hydrolase family 3 C-terminal domain-containing protein [Streptomyces sp. MA3_2.13]
MPTPPASAADDAGQDRRPRDRDDAELVARVRALDVAAKVRLLTGAALWSTGAEPRLGLLPVVLSDGPQGVRGIGDVPDATGLLAPAPSAVAASWDPELAERLGELFAAEARRKGVDVLLAPAVNLQRTPVAGRHFEYFAEDPLLTAAVAGGLVRGLQRHGVAGCLKHYVANDSETERTAYRAQVDQRTLREVYLAPFEAVLAESDAWSVMSAYSGVDDGELSAPMGEHTGLLRGVLKDEWGFDGPVISDWAATRSTVPSALGGLDLVMPGPGGPWGDALVAAVEAGEVPESVVDDKVLRLLWLAGRVGRLVAPWDPDEEAPEPRPATGGAPTEREFALLRSVAARGTVLLRDTEGLLPLDGASLSRVALIGPNAVRPYFQGGGSAFVPPNRLVGYAEGLRAALPEARVTVARGGDARRHAPFVDPESLVLRAEFLDTEGHFLGAEELDTGDLTDYRSFPAETHRVLLRGTVTLTEPGRHQLEIGTMGRFAVRVADDEVATGDDDRGVGLVLDSSHSHPPGHTVELTVGESPRAVPLEIDLTVVDAGGYGRIVTCHLRHLRPGAGADEEIAEAVAAARAAEVAVVVVGTNEEVESEGWDRSTLALPGRQDELVRRVAAANPRTVVVVNAGAPVLLPWADEVGALLWGWLPGQEAGHALADVLLGRAEPTGRLPFTLPARADDVPVPHAVPEAGLVRYAEGRDVGYRGWDRAGREPAFPFGHGLGFGAWSYESVEVDTDDLPEGRDLTVKVAVRNTSGRDAREVVQVYLAPPPGEDGRPLRALAGSAVLAVAAGGGGTATVTVPARAFQVWSRRKADWRTPPGRCQLLVGRSSRDIRLTREVRVGTTG